MNKGNRFLSIAKQTMSSLADGWENIFTGLGVAGKDKRTGMRARYKTKTEREVEELYDIDDIAAKVINMIPEEATREWIKIKIPEDVGLSEKIHDSEKALKMQKKVEKAMKWGRLYGGAAIFLSVDDGLELHEPLNTNRLVRLKSLTVLHRYELQAQDVNRDIEDENFGLPDFYTISPRSGESIPRIHHSRIVRFPGSEISSNAFISNNYWEDSVLVRLFNVLRNFNLAHDSTASVIQDFNIGILKLKNLADMIGADEDNAVTERLRLMNMAKSIMGTILLDADEETYENKSVPLANLDKVLDKVNERLVAGTGMPHTKILGNGPKSTLSGAGDSEEKDWLAHVGNMQESILREPIQRILFILLVSRQGPTNGKLPIDWSWDFNPLWNPSEKDIVETRNKQSMTDKNYWEMGSLSGSKIAESRFGGEEYSIETHVDPDEIKQQKETEEIDPDDAKKIIEDELESEPETDTHWHLDSIGGGNTGPAINWGTNAEGKKTHVHRRPNRNMTDQALTGVPHTHFTKHGETGPVLNNK